MDSQENLIKEEKCEVCQIPSKKFCSACTKVYYCTPEHQKSHWKKHKVHCYPALLKTDVNLGRYFVATRNIKQGEVIFKDKALVSGPSAAEIFFRQICLGCYRLVTSDYKCSKCNWPVCNETCEKMIHHAEFECKIFSEKNISAHFTKAYEYDYINFLRSLLLKLNDQSKWAEIAQLASHSEARAKNEFAASALKTTVDFLREKCQLTQFDTATIDHVVGVWGINSFGANPPTAYPNPQSRLATLLFPKLCLAAHNCIPNTRGVLSEDIKASMPTYNMELIAALAIKAGDQIFTTYANVTEGSFERRRILRDNYFFNCNCARCADPAECGTYYSAFKCISCLQNDSEGYCLPKEPLDLASVWICDNCSIEKNYKELAYPLLEKIKCQMNALGNEANFQSINQLERTLTSYQDIWLHPNHWLMLEVEYRLLHRIVGFLPNTQGIQEESLIKRIVTVAEHCLSVANVLQPGLTIYRGKILYCLCQAKLQEIIKLAQGVGGYLQTEKINSLKKVAEEARDILSRETEGSEDKIISKLLSDDLNQIEKLNGLLKLQRNSRLFF